jgi:hypothetical protein
MFPPLPSAHPSPSMPPDPRVHRRAWTTWTNPKSATRPRPSIRRLSVATGLTSVSPLPRVNVPLQKPSHFSLHLSTRGAAVSDATRGRRKGKLHTLVFPCSSLSLPTLPSPYPDVPLLYPLQQHIGGFCGICGPTTNGDGAAVKDL